MDQRGDATVAWTLPTKSGNFAQVARRPYGHRWRAPVTVSPLAPDLEVSGVGMDDLGDTSVVWWQWQSIGDDLGSVAVAQRPAHGHWQPAYVLTQPDVGVNNASLAMGPDGTITVAWLQYPSNSPTSEVSVAQRPSTGPWEPTRSLEAGEDQEETAYPDVAAGNAGRAVVTWPWVVDNGSVIHAAWR